MQGVLEVPRAADQSHRVGPLLPAAGPGHAPWGPAANRHLILLCPDEMERSGDQAWGCCDDPRPSSTGAVDLGNCPRIGHRPEDGSPNYRSRPGASSVWTAQAASTTD